MNIVSDVSNIKDITKMLSQKKHSEFDICHLVEGECRRELIADSSIFDWRNPRFRRNTVALTSAVFGVVLDGELPGSKA